MNANLNFTDIISKKKLWFRPSDNKLPEATRVSARVNNYPKYFTRQDGVMSLNIKNNASLFHETDASTALC